MYKGSHSAPERGGKRNRKPFVLLISLVLLAALAVGGTFAYLKANTDPVTNSFTAGTGGIDIHEDKDGTEKKSVTIENTGNSPAYVRVAVTVNNVDKEGHITGSSERKPVTTNKWQELDGYYYYKGIVQPGADNAVRFLAEAFDYTGLEVNIMAQGIQAAGGFEKEAWGHTFDPSDSSWT